MTKWEYTFQVIDLSLVMDPSAKESSLAVYLEQLNALGVDGWEVVSIIPKTGAGDEWTIVLLKRPLQVT